MQTSRSKTILIVILSLIVIASSIAGIVLSMKDKSESNQNRTNQTPESLEISEADIANDKLLKDKYPEINALILKYREGLTNGDVTILQEVYNTEDEISNDVLTSTSKIIEGYSNTACYTKRGLEDNSYFVFIYDHLKITDIATTVPNLTMVYVKTAPDGQVNIYRGEKNTSTGVYEYDAATQQYILNLYEDDEVKDLMATVYQEKEEACARDEQLRNFIDGLSSPSSDVTNETVSDTDTLDESETPETEEIFVETETAE